MAIESEVDDSGGESAWIRRSRGFGENVGAETTRDTTTRMVYKTICTRRKEKSIMIVRVETCSRETRSVSHSFCTCQASRIATIAKTPYSQWPLKYTGAAVFWLLNGGALLECSQRTIRRRVRKFVLRVRVLMVLIAWALLQPATALQCQCILSVKFLRREELDLNSLSLQLRTWTRSSRRRSSKCEPVAVQSDLLLFLH